MSSPTRTIVIIGGGFCGTVLAANLLRAAPCQPTRIVLVEQRAEIGRGVAYQSGGEQYLLNVPAGRMSADGRDPSQFLRFAQRRYGAVTGADFLPRRLYGEYLQELLSRSEQAAPGHVRLHRVLGQGLAIQRLDHADSFLVEVSGNGGFSAREVVLACGDPAPVCPEFARGVEYDARYVCDPYRPAALQAPARSMFVIGTGLTAADSIVTAAALHPGLAIYALSRHGLLPAVQGGGAVEAHDLTLPAANAAALSTRQVVREIRALARATERRGGDWRDAVTVARHAAPRLWGRLTLPERRRFLRHVRSYWDVHRHRLPPAVAARLVDLRRAGQLQIAAGRVLAIDPESDSLKVSWRPRGSERTVSSCVERVVNCTGADQRLGRCREPLLAGLLRSGLAVSDPLGIGLRVGRFGALLDRDGRTDGRLFYLGPMLRAQHWEATAVGELRFHAEQLAQSLAAGRAYATSAP